jgi:hypothetical protein
LMNTFSVGRRSFRLSKRRKKSWNVGHDIPDSESRGVVVYDGDDHLMTPKKLTFHPRSRAEIRTHYHHYVQDYDVLHFPSPVTPINPYQATG